MGQSIYMNKSLPKDKEKRPNRLARVDSKPLVNIEEGISDVSESKSVGDSESIDEEEYEDEVEKLKQACRPKLQLTGNNITSMRFMTKFLRENP